MSAMYELMDDVAVVRLNQPPMNGLSLSTRQDVMQSLERSAADPQVKAVILIGSEKAFSSGADISEFDSARAYQEPNLLTLVDAVEQHAKPVVAALSGVVMGGGLELAMACHGRVAVKGCRMAMPEVKLGLVPGAGGTQRLPRAIGVEPALNMILQGQEVTAEALYSLPEQRLLNQAVESWDDLLREALIVAREVAAAHAAGGALPKLSALTCRHPKSESYFAFARTMVKGMAKGLPAPMQCVTLVEAATQRKFVDGQALELQVFKDLMASPESAAFRHLFLAERAASKIKDVPSTTPVRDIQSIAVIGAGTMGGGIAMNFLNAGIPVQILETQQEALDRGIGVIRRNYEAQVKKGKLTQEKFDTRLSLLSTTLNYADITQADLVIEAVFEDMKVKESVFKQLDQTMKSGAILASNTSTLDLNHIAEFTKRPEDVVGMHFFSPANVMKLLEVVRGEKTAKDVLATVMALGKKIRKTCVVSGVCDGFIGNRMIDPYFRQAAFLLEEGCTPMEVDRAIEKFGFPMGPFRMSDLAGNDIGWHIRQRHASEKPHIRHSRIPDLICEKGRFGQKTGSGWYDYIAGQREALPSAEVLSIIDSYRAQRGISVRKIDAQEIVMRLVLALVNEGARILEEGIAERAGDIDMVYLTGYGFPAWRGGPMHYAEQLGLYRASQWMKRFAAMPNADRDFWRPADLIEQLAAQGLGFAAATSGDQS